MWAAILMTAAQAGAAIPCPSVSKGKALDAIAIYDGPVADNAVLAPDVSRTTSGVLTQDWSVAGVYRQGRVLTIRCGYKGGADLWATVRKPVAACCARWGGKGGRLTCS